MRADGGGGGEGKDKLGGKKREKGRKVGGVKERGKIGIDGEMERL